MPWKLILLVIVMIFVAIFVGANHANVCNISLVFMEFQKVPVYITILVSFIVGMLIMLPFTFGKRHGKSARQQKNGGNTEFPVREEYPAESARNRKNRKRQEAAARKTGRISGNDINNTANIPNMTQPLPAASIEIPAITDGTSSNDTSKTDASKSAKKTSGGKGFFGLFSKKNKKTSETTDETKSDTTTPDADTTVPTTGTDIETKPEDK